MSESATLLPMSLPERKELERHEETIRKGLHDFREVGQAIAAIRPSKLEAFRAVGAALQAIRDRKLFRATHGDDFHRYCLETWALGANYANRLIQANGVVNGLLACGAPVLPRNEAQARALIGLDPEMAALVLSEAGRAGPVTAARLSDERARVEGAEAELAGHAAALAEEDAVSRAGRRLDAAERELRALPGRKRAAFAAALEAARRCLGRLARK